MGVDKFPDPGQYENKKTFTNFQNGEIGIMKTVRLKDIAQACGVSVATVSRTLEVTFRFEPRP